jgi:YHS domain-containing protein
MAAAAMAASSLTVISNSLRLRNYKPSYIPVASQVAVGELATDPVCKMHIKKEGAAATSFYQKETYYFCSLGCKKAFDKEPQKYLAELK